MKVRLIAAVVAVVLAAVGTMALLAYVRGADQRALANTETVPVLVAAAPIQQGATVESLGEKVTVTQLPRMAVLSDAATSVDQLAGLAANVPLQPGEQLLRTKFATPDAARQNAAGGAAAAGDQKPAAVAIPPGLQAVTIRLNELERTVDGTIEAGDTVGVFLTFRPPMLPPSTHLTFQKVLVTAVRTDGAAAAAPADPAAAPTTPADGGTQPADGTTAAADGVAAATDETAPAAPTSGAARFVTLALNARDAEQVVFAAEFGTIWLSDEPQSAIEGDTGIVTPESVFR